MNSSRHSQQRTLRWVGLVGLFLLAFLPRAIHPVSRPLQWYFRSSEFMQAILNGDWAATLQSEHPGVTVMWLSGAALWGWYGLQSLAGLDAATPLETEGYAFADRVAVGVLPLALIIALSIIWGWSLLRRLFGEKVAWVGALLWAMDPFLLANSKALHLDATLSMLMILSALSMLVYLQESRLQHLVTSAALGGLAILTKISAVFLVPFLVLALVVHTMRSADHPEAKTSGVSGGLIGRSVLSALAWVLIAASLAFLLWPSLWVQPGESLDLLIGKGILSKVDPTHSLPRFHRGKTFIGDPGAGYYLDTVLYRATLLTLPFGVVGLGAVLARRWRRVLGLLLIGFVFFFFLQMSLGGRKEERYMLPVLLMWDLLAACGMVWLVDRMPIENTARVVAFGGLLALQGGVVFTHHPYYGTHYNVLLGGARAASRVLAPGEWGEGLDLAGRYVDRQVDAENGVVGTQFLANEMVAQYVRAPVHDVARVGDDADYLVFGVQYTVRGSSYPRWGELWNQTYRFREPVFVAGFSGLPYAWVHKPDAEPVIPQRVDARVGEDIRMLGYRLARREVAPDEPLLVTLYWQAKDPVERAYTVFTHLQGPDGELIAQQDNPPVAGTRPTDGWTVGALVEDPYEIELPGDVPMGEYVLSCGMYDPVTMDRLPVYRTEDENDPDPRLVLTTVRVQPQVPSWRWVLSGGWIVMIAGSLICACMGRRER